MNYRRATMLSTESIATAGIKVIDFKLKDIISRIQIQPKLTNTSGSPTAHPATAISKIEIIDGSDILWSLTGKQCSALNFYSMGKPAIDLISYVNDVQCVPMMNINFGRWLFDEDLAFDATRFNNPQLKITHNLAAGGIAPDAGTIQVKADVFDEIKPSPQGWLMAKEYHSYTPSASAYKYIDMPTDYPLRMLLLQYLYGGQMPSSGINEIKLSEENDKKIPIDETTTDLLKGILDEFGLYEENVVATVSTANVSHFVAPTYLTHNIGSDNLTTAAYTSFGECYGGTVNIIGSAASVVRFKSSGYLPHGVIPLLFGEKWEPSKWWDVTKLGSLELRLKASATVGGTAQVITEQLRRY